SPHAPSPTRVPYPTLFRSVAAGVDGLIAVNARAGGHAGPREPEALFQELAPLGLPVVSAGGVSTAAEFARHLNMGYTAVQMGTRSEEHTSELQSRENPL